MERSIHLEGTFATLDVPQATLDALTDVDMLRLKPEPLPSGHVRIAGLDIAVHASGCVVVGSGAAGLRAAVEMRRRGVAVTILSQSAWGGTLACSGSDKQTLHTANTADQGDNFRALNSAIVSQGIALDRTRNPARAIQHQQMALASEAILAALDHYIRAGGGSRGARAICDPKGDCLPQDATGPLADCRFRAETPAHAAEQILLRLRDGRLQITTRPNRPLDEGARPFFERDWLTGRIYDRTKDAPW